MDTLTVTLPVLHLHEGMLASSFLREVPYLVRGVGDETRCLNEAATAVARGRGSVSLTVTTLGLTPLARTCRVAIADTYRDNPAAPVLRAIAEACEAALAGLTTIERAALGKAA